MVKLILLTLIVLLAGLIESANADEVYSFQFEKSPVSAKPRPLDEHTQVSASVATVNIGPEPGWGAGFVFSGAIETDTYREERTIGFTGEYRYNKYIGGEAQIVFGRGDDRNTHASLAIGARVTPFHIHVLDWDLLNLAGTIGIMNATTQTDPNRARVAIFIGFDVIMNIAERFALIYSEKHEEGISGRGQKLFSGLYRF